ncbi:proline-rich receptor-like protein kinase PERK9 [Iris pallida]|uniref:Proline-rich receptor-like protein kinase PERK9 n=1 Tax=Iris pallida TaxID=29817 RepID=A0AAX6HA40_IRIPA|nr:proline-rich receptor-like protein kinase PERK9 [Iris pallida]
MGWLTGMCGGGYAGGRRGALDGIYWWWRRWRRVAPVVVLMAGKEKSRGRVLMWFRVYGGGDVGRVWRAERLVEGTELVMVVEELPQGCWRRRIRQGDGGSGVAGRWRCCHWWWCLPRVVASGKECGRGHGATARIRTRVRVVSCVTRLVSRSETVGHGRIFVFVKKNSGWEGEHGHDAQTLVEKFGL